MNLIVDHSNNFNDSQSLLDMILALSDFNKKTLGLLPRKAITDFHNHGQILAAFYQNEFAGYLLYRLVKTRSRVSITHLCVKDDMRGLKVSDALISRLKEICISLNLSGILSKTRIDFKYAEAVWKRADFYPRTETESKSGVDKPLVNWWWSNKNAGDLFSFGQIIDDNKVSVGIDHNILISLHDSEDLVQVLSADWLSNEIDISINSESYIEIMRHSDLDRRSAIRNFMSNFAEISYDENDYLDCKHKLLQIFPKPRSPQDTSDINQIAKFAAANINYFLTNDKAILSLSTEIIDEVGIFACDPIELLLHFDEKLQESKYSPFRLAGSLIISRKVRSSDIKLLAQEFLVTKYQEKSSYFQMLLNKHLTTLDENNNLEVITNDDAYEALIGWKINPENNIDIYMFRIKNSQLSSTLSLHIIQKILNYAFLKDINKIIISEKFIHLIDFELREFGFFKINNQWIKILINRIENSKSFLTSHYVESNFSADEADFLRCNKVDDLHTIIETEKKFWPLKFENVSIPVYVIPIKPYWAKNLFDNEIANEDLFGCDPSISMNIRNVYYSASTKKICAPARILWYISQDNSSNFSGAIRATSYLDCITKDKPKSLFSKFRRLGTYSWTDVLSCASNQLDKEITAITFSNTEMLSKPVNFNEFVSLLSKHKIKSNNLVSPLEISQPLFFEIYQGYNESVIR